jgi:hypothetical protein
MSPVKEGLVVEWLDQTGVDGPLRICQEHPEINGLASAWENEFAQLGDWGIPARQVAELVVRIGIGD